MCSWENEAGNTRLLRSNTQFPGPGQLCTLKPRGNRLCCRGNAALRACCLGACPVHTEPRLIGADRTDSFLLKAGPPPGACRRPPGRLKNTRAIFLVPQCTPHGEVKCQWSKLSTECIGIYKY